MFFTHCVAENDMFLLLFFYDERIFISFFKVRFDFNKIFSENLELIIYYLGFLVYCFAVKVECPSDK